MSFPIVDEAPTASVGKCPSSDGYNASNSIPLALVQQGVAHIILYSTLSTLLFVLLCVVLMKDGLSPSKRRTPVVWLLGLAMLLGVIGSALDTVFWATQMLWTTSSSAQTASYYVASNSMLFIVPWVVRWAMCLRIASFYPVTLAGRRKRLTVIALPTAMQILDLVAFCIVLHDGFDAIETAGQDDGKLTLSLSEKPLPYRLMVNLLAYGAALVSSIYINIFMIRKFTTLRGGASRGSPTLATPPRNLSWAKQQQLLFGIAFSYITPTLFLVSLIVIFCTVQGRALGFMLVCNVYVHVFSGTLACLSAWANIGGNLSGGSTYYPKHAEGERQVSIGDVSALSGRSGSRSASLAQTASGIGLGSNGGNLATVGQLRRHCDNGSGLSPPKQDGVVVAGGTSVAPFHNAARLNDSNMLLAVEPSSGVTLHNNVLSVPKSLPVSESKLLLHQRRRVSLVISNVPRELDWPGGSDLDNRYQRIVRSASDRTDTWSHGAGADGSWEFIPHSPRHPAHIELPPPEPLVLSTKSSGEVPEALSSAQIEISPCSLTPAQRYDGLGTAANRAPVAAREAATQGELDKLDLEKGQSDTRGDAINGRMAAIEVLDDDNVHRRGSAISAERRSSTRRF